MTVLVVYASRHGATRGIAERIAATLSATGQRADVHPSDEVRDLSGYDAFVIGAAIYYGHWRKPAAAFVQRNMALLVKRPVWLFSSGPLGSQTPDAQGHRPPEAEPPIELGELREAVRSRGERVFYGALDPARLTLPERTVRRVPAGRALLPEGDFRNWADIDAWAQEIARELSEPKTRALKPEATPLPG